MKESCVNKNTNFCTDNVHNIISAMLDNQEKQYFIGHLFDGDYLILENEKCVQYIQEYVPLHLPQIIYVLKELITKIFNKR